MPKILRQSLINLTAFRQRNGILQKDLAKYLDVSRGYISMVESGKSSLAKESLDKLYDNPKHWNVEDLVPAYTRLNQALEYLNIKRNEQRAVQGLPPTLFSMGEDDEFNIKYGYSGIPEYIADMWCSGAPELNQEWLLTGIGEMLVNANQDSPSQIEVLQQKIDELEASLEEFKTFIDQMIESVPEKVVAALQSMSKT